MTCTKYIKTLCGLTAPLLSRLFHTATDQEGGGEGLQVRGKAPPVCPPASYKGRFPWTF